MDEGFCVVEMIFNAEGQPVDYRFVETNPAFEKHTGLQEAVGRRMRELAPNHESHWFEVYGKVAVTGERARFVNVATALQGRWYDVYSFRLGGPESRKVAIFFSDITERRRNEEALKEADRRKDEFLATLAHELRNPLARSCVSPGTTERPSRKPGP
jgi:PAS domain S-box-containing protein